MGIWSRLFGAGEAEPAPAEPPRAQEALDPDGQPTVETPRVRAPRPPAPTPPRPPAVPEVEPTVRAASPADEEAPGEPADAPAPGAPADAADLEARLEQVLETLGSAHRRPFTRAN